MNARDTPRPSTRAAEAATMDYVARVVIAVAIVALAWIALELRDVLVIAFGSIVAAVGLRTLAAPLQQRTRLGERPALAVVVVTMLLVASLGTWWVGAPVAEQFDALGVALPQAFEGLMRWLRGHEMGLLLLRAWDGDTPDIAWGRIAGFAGSTLGALSALVLMTIAGIYLAADPRTYRDGALHLLPPARRRRTREALDLAADRLSRWLLIQGVSMLVVGVLIGVGLAALGLPLAVPLGVIAGLLEFIPFFGTMASSVLIVLLASSQGLTATVHAALLCLAVQQLEGNVLQPLLQRRAVAMPPALGLIAVMVFGALGGPLGAVFATPAMVVLMVFVRHLYVDGVIEDRAA